MNITMIGTGYVGLVTGTCFANVGHNVWCLDNDVEKITNLQNGIIPIFEPGLESLVKTNLERGTLQVSTDAKKLIQSAEVIFIAVGTPPDEDGKADLQYVLTVARQIGEHMNGPKIIVDKSTKKVPQSMISISPTV